MIYRMLGNTKEIISILEPQGYEADLLYEIMDEGIYEDLELIDDSDTPDIVVDSWNKILLEPGSKILWPDLFEMDVRTREQQEQAEGKAGGEAGGEAGRESLRELELKLNKRMDDGFALRDETIRLLAAREGDEETEKHGDKEGDEEGEDNGDKDGDEAEAEKDDGEKQIEAEAEKLMQERFDDDGDEQSTLQIMADTAERFEKAAAEKTAADKTNEVADDDDALEKEGEVGVDVSLEETASEAASVGVDEMPMRVSKRSHLLMSPFTPN
ncbi:unnamed protein product [Brassica oleracea var. botrytis]|uniref:(rape) hypothetical protein n=1 Tax=Brassica napus TaxID=3708 RepID=A0A816JPW5_BRANA|nr:unnamed protein product [Brassica napus]